MPDQTGAQGARSPEFHRLGDFELLREIGRGGMGVVYEARQVSLNRLVALKALTGIGLTPQIVRRFQREAEAAGKLQHTNIVPVFATGEEHGTYYYVMALVDGCSLDKILRQLRKTGDPAVLLGGLDSTQTDLTSPEDTAIRGGFTLGHIGDTTVQRPGGDIDLSSLGSGNVYFDGAARMIAEVAEALDYAHKQGVIHRDIKPSNLLLSLEGRLCINDFGLARILEQPGLTVTGEFLGTPRYMSPEQAGGRPVDHRTDVFSLGATLYELLTLAPPFPGQRRDEVLEQILRSDPKPLRKLNRRIPLDLETICLKALEKDPNRRYESAGAMAADLRRYLSRFPIAARRAGPARQISKWIHRHPNLAVSCVVGLVLLVTTVYFAYSAHTADRDRNTVRQELQTERRQKALDKALAAAMSGDLEESEKAIAAAEESGASAGEIELLQGLLAYCRGDEARAVQSVERSVQLLPASVWARAFLARLYASTGQFQKRDQELRVLDSLQAETPEDFLFKGSSQRFADASKAIKDLDEAIRRHDSPIPRSMRAEIRSAAALDTGSLDDARLALEDVAVAKGMLPANPQTLYASVLAQIAAAAAYEQHGMRGEMDKALASAANDATALRNFDTLPTAILGRAAYADYTGRDDPGLEAVWERAVAQGTSDFIVSGLAARFYRQGRFALARDILQQSRYHDLQLIEVPSELVKPALGTGTRIDKMPDQLIDKCRTPYDIPSCASVLLFLGNKPEAVATCRRLREKLGRPDARPDLSLLRYLCGEISASELLKNAGTSRFHQCRFHYLLALSELAVGNRQGAQMHFRKAIDTRYYASPAWDWSRSFLECLGRDAKWPPWIAEHPQ
jgi:serine/threonine protein kinase